MVGCIASFDFVWLLVAIGVVCGGLRLGCLCLQAVVFVA